MFSAVMALTNFAGSGSEAFGRWLFETAKYDGKAAFAT